MESDLEDVKRITEFINDQKKTNYQNNFQLEFQDFIAFRQENDLDDEYFLEEDSGEETAIKDFDLPELSVQVPITALTEDERSVIDSCTDPDLKRLLILNRTKNMQLMKLHKKVIDLIHKCDKFMHEKYVIMKNLENKHMYRQQSSLWKLAAPYFKDKKFYPCTPNEDVERKRLNGDLTAYDLIPSLKWTPVEIDRLMNAVKFNYNVNRQNQIVARISAIKAQRHSEEDVDEKYIAELNELEEELQEVKEDDKIPPLDSDECINWHKVSETFLKDKHTPNECRSVWHLLVHPDINKSQWSEEENQNLEAIAKRHSYQNWDDIAAELNTKRTGFTTCLHYFSKLCDKFKKNKFTPEEDKLLVEIVDSCKEGNHIPWNKVASHFDNRSRHQLYHRYMYFLSQNHVKKGKFTEAEDILLIILVNKFGRNFKKCAEYMPHRSQVQLKSRYISNLQREIKKGTFTEEDDQMILDYVRDHGEKNWSGLTIKLNRCNAQIRQRYKLIKTFLQTHPKKRLEDVPKRKHNFDKASEDQYGFLNYMAEQYKDADCIPTLQMIEDSLQVELESPTSSQNKSGKKKASFKNIDAMLTDFFVNSLKSKRNNVNDMNINEACNNVEEVLSLLGANLNIPKVFEFDIHLDTVDVAILDKLSKTNFEQPVNSLLTPNISTLVGLRSLIIKHKDYKNEQKGKNAPSTSKSDQPALSMEQGLARLSEKTKRDILFHRELFSKRFEALFDWSALLSLENPNRSSVASEPNGRETPVRTYGRRPVDNSDAPVVKKRKIQPSTDLGRQSSSNGPKLKVVDKSVVEKLMKSKGNINIIPLATFTDSKGVIKPVSSQPNNLRINESPATNDLHKLDVMLKSKKLQHSEDYTNEEYRAIQGDVQLLKEILEYEKVKIEPDIDD